MCFKNEFYFQFFKLVKTIPLDRTEGKGADNSRGLNLAIEKLRQKKWVLLFPEGKLSQSADYKMNPIRNGVARLILEGNNPRVYPLYHQGMQYVLPQKTFIPKTGKKIKVILGDEIDFLDIIDSYEKQSLSKDEAYKLIRDRIAQRYEDLRKQLSET